MCSRAMGTAPCRRYTLPLRAAALLATVALLAGGCGGGSSGGSSGDPIEQVPEESGLRAQVKDAQNPTAADFPATGGASLQQLATRIGGGGPQAALANSVLTVGRNRLAFGMIDPQGSPVYGKSAVYVARTPDSKALGPYPAPADVLITSPPFRSKQAATESDPFAAIYAADVPFPKPGRWTLMAVTRSGSRLVAAPGQVKVTTKREDPVPDVGERAPKVQTDTLASAKGDQQSIDTRIPPAPDLHRRSFSEVLGSKPVALLFATPQLCESRVCGPVTDIALEMQAKYGDRMEFIHQEVFAGNDPSQGLRPPLKRFNLKTEPWLFVVDGDGNVTARLEGSFGLGAFEEAVKTAL